jgi:hypothetical protein
LLGGWSCPDLGLIRFGGKSCLCIDGALWGGLLSVHTNSFYLVVVGILLYSPPVFHLVWSKKSSSGTINSVLFIIPVLFYTIISVPFLPFFLGIFLRSQLIRVVFFKGG